MTSARTFGCEPESVTAARRFARDALRGRSPDVIDVVELMVSELATNSVRHARSEFELAIEDSGGQIRVEVRDSGHGQPTLQAPAPEEASGRGLRIVEAMSEAWGVIRAPDAKTVWFTLSPQFAAADDGLESAAPSQGKTADDDNKPPARRHRTAMLARRRLALALVRTRLALRARGAADRRSAWRVGDAAARDPPRLRVP